MTIATTPPDCTILRAAVLDTLALARKALSMLRRADSAQLKAFWREIADSADIAYFEAQLNLAIAMGTYDTPTTGGAA